MLIESWFCLCILLWKETKVTAANKNYFKEFLQQQLYTIKQRQKSALLAQLCYSKLRLSGRKLKLQTTSFLWTNIVSTTQGNIMWIQPTYIASNLNYLIASIDWLVVVSPIVVSQNVIIWMFSTFFLRKCHTRKWGIYTWRRNRSASMVVAMILL